MRSDQSSPTTTIIIGAISERKLARLVEGRSDLADDDTTLRRAREGELTPMHLVCVSRVAPDGTAEHACTFHASAPYAGTVRACMGKLSKTPDEINLIARAELPRGLSTVQVRAPGDAAVIFRARVRRVMTPRRRGMVVWSAAAATEEGAAVEEEGDDDDDARRRSYWLAPAECDLALFLAHALAAPRGLLHYTYEPFEQGWGVGAAERGGRSVQFYRVGAQHPLPGGTTA